MYGFSLSIFLSPDDDDDLEIPRFQSQVEESGESGDFHFSRSRRSHRKFTARLTLITGSGSMIETLLRVGWKKDGRKVIVEKQSRHGGHSIMNRSTCTKWYLGLSVGERCLFNPLTEYGARLNRPLYAEDSRQKYPVIRVFGDRKFTPGSSILR